MKTITIDASCAVSWLFPEQRTAAADRLLRDAGRYRFAAPDVFAWEIGNFIIKRSRLTGTDPNGVLERLEALDIRIAAARDPSEVLELTQAATVHGLSLFDTAYLIHALATRGGLASRDERLLAAAGAAGVDVMDMRD